MKNKLPRLVVILIITLITVIMWVSLNVFRALTIKPSPVVPPDISKPLNPSLDTTLLNEINSRLLIDASQIPEFVIAQTPLPTPIAAVTPIPSPTPESSPLEEATDSGILQ